jgi:hypothetical protein
MTGSRLCLIPEHWPEVDRERWRVAQEPPGFLEPDKPANRWGLAHSRIVEQAYGQWLAFLNRNDALDPSSTPGGRATEGRLCDFITELRARVAPVSAALITDALVRMLRVLEPVAMRAHQRALLQHAFDNAHHAPASVVVHRGPLARQPDQGEQRKIAGRIDKDGIAGVVRGVTVSALQAQVGRNHRGKLGHQRRDGHHTIRGIRHAFDFDAAGGDEVGQRVGHGRPPMRLWFGDDFPGNCQFGLQEGRLAPDSGA